MGGGVILLAVMASLLEPAMVIPLHGLVQMITNGTRSFLLLGRVRWDVFGLYVPFQLLGVIVAATVYVETSLQWLRPTIGGFVLAYLLWDRFKPQRLRVPLWVLAPAGFGGGLLTIFVGATGPYLAAFFLREDMSKEQIVATKAAIQMVGHVAKIPAFLAIGFPYREHVDVVLPLVGVAILGTWLGTRLLHRMRAATFGRAFRLVLAALALRLVLDPVI